MTHPIRAASWFLLAVWVPGILGCRHNNAINFVTNTQFGLKVGVNAEKIPEVQVGYNRQEAARVPTYLEQETKQREAATQTLSSATPTVNSILSEALNQLKLDSAQGDKSASELISHALLLGKAPDGSNPSSLLALIESKSRSDGTPDAATHRAVLKGLIQAELNKPQAVAEFHEWGKFVATRSGSASSDAYSVLGTFSGNASGSAGGSGTNASMRISQFFATGVAAQLLAEKGGAATVNPNSKAPGEGLTVDDIAKIQGSATKRESLRQDQAQNIGEHVFQPTAAGTAPDEADRLTRLKALRAPGKTDPSDAVLSRLAKADSVTKLAKRLQDLEDDERQALSGNLP